MKKATFGAEVALATARMADELALARDCGAIGELLEAQVVRRVDWFAIELGQQNVCDGARHALRRALKQIGKAGVDPTVTHTNRGVERSETPESYVKDRHRRARPKCAVLLLEDCNNVGGHVGQDSRQGGKSGQQGAESRLRPQSLWLGAVLVLLVWMSFEVSFLISRNLLGLLAEVTARVESLL